MDKGEAALTDREIGHLAPDLASHKGHKLVKYLVDQAEKVKPDLDSKFKMVTMTAELDPAKDFESRIKKDDTIIKKVALHRRDGDKGYRVNNVNDLYGARIIVKNDKQKKDVIDAIHQMDEDNTIKIDHEQEVKHGTYEAHHMDFNFKGVKGEIQLHTPASLFEAASNHDIRSVFGEKPPKPLQDVKDIHAKVAEKVSPKKAQDMAQALELVRRIQTQ